MAADPAFVDTNVLVYASQTQSAFHGRATAVLNWARQEQRELWISRQILREYLATVTRPQRDTPPLPVADSLADVGWLGRLLNIAATMLAHGIPRLLTFNAADFRRFEPLIEVVVP